MNVYPLLQAEGGLADDVLQSAQHIVNRHTEKFTVYGYSSPWDKCSPENQHLLTLLDQLIGAIEPVANEIADNAWDEQSPVPKDGAKGLADALRKVADIVESSASI